MPEILDYFRISIESIDDPVVFFGEPLHDVSDVISIKELQDIEFSLHKAPLSTIIEYNQLDSMAARILKRILAICTTHTDSEGYVDDLSKHLLEAFGYDNGELLISSQESLQLEMCNGMTSARPDVCVLNSELLIKLLVQEDKSFKTYPKRNAIANAESQVIAEAIAAFQDNEKMREALSLPKKASHLIPCITMIGTRPTFYLVNVTTALADAVKRGEEPAEETVCQRFSISPTFLPQGDAMLSKDVRLKIFQCYATFKKFVLESNESIW